MMNYDNDEKMGKQLKVYGKAPVQQISACCDLLDAEKDEVIQRLRGQLQNCVNHLDLAKRKGYGGSFDECIESANRALYETLGI